MCPFLSSLFVHISSCPLCHCSGKLGHITPGQPLQLINKGSESRADERMAVESHHYLRGTSHSNMQSLPMPISISYWEMYRRLSHVFSKLTTIFKNLLHERFSTGAHTCNNKVMTDGCLGSVLLFHNMQERYQGRATWLCMIDSNYNCSILLIFHDCKMQYIPLQQHSL